MFTIKKEEPKTPRTKNKSFRLPIEQIKYIEDLAFENNISEAQVVIQMINYCINGE